MIKPPERQLTESSGSGAKGFTKIEPSGSKNKRQNNINSNSNETQSADQAEGGNAELFNTGRLLSSA